ncbi:hypothetical protein I3842_04G153800 [Carya illinoinensis]|uniref:Uncharacterized protein n=1 Tax=Carya illinoinensis TaxID=32201 RepID=A0A922JS49_CARIL|nr:hypothetical protein I3842_04G153800 [Carya illinoinensis]
MDLVLLKHDCPTTMVQPHGQDKSLIVDRGVNAMDVEASCTIEQISLTSWPGQIDADHPINISPSCTDLRNLFSYGFVLSWYSIYCGSCSEPSSYCYMEDDNKVSCSVSGLIGFSKLMAFYVASDDFSGQPEKAL